MKNVRQVGYFQEFYFFGIYVEEMGTTTGIPEWVGDTLSET